MLQEMIVTFQDKNSILFFLSHLSSGCFEQKKQWKSLSEVFSWNFWEKNAKVDPQNGLRQKSYLSLGYDPDHSCT